MIFRLVLGACVVFCGTTAWSIDTEQSPAVNESVDKLVQLLNGLKSSPDAVAVIRETVRARNTSAQATAVASANWGISQVDFNRTVRPILSNYCYACHGPDAKQRKADLRLDDGVGVFEELPSGVTAVIPGKPSKSALIHRITHADVDERMPPEELGKSISPMEVAILEQWIREGAQWDQHWSFNAPKRPTDPEVSDESWVQNPIDGFVLAKLDAEGLTPREVADRSTLIRRVSFDLTGLPPTPEAVKAFVNDTSSNAYENLVDRLLASPQYGEHMGRFWLDLARYADTNGYHIDNERYMWRWRDWVIDAFNTNVPFDKFTIEQLAGDLLPEPTTSQRIATGFNRNHMINFEGGAIPEEYRTQYVVDRLTSTSTVWMGLTVACAQCHDHKFDPISQTNFYEMFAFFNTIPEKGLDGNSGNAAPFIKAPLTHQADELVALREEIARLEAEMKRPMPETDKAQWAWEKQWQSTLQERWIRLVPEHVTSSGGSTLTIRDDQSVLASGENPAKDTYEIIAPSSVRQLSAIRVEALTDETMKFNGAGRADNANFVLTEVVAEFSSADEPDAWKPIELVSAMADFAQNEFPAKRTIDGNVESGWGVGGDKRRENRVLVLSPASLINLPEGGRLRIRLRHESKYAKHAMGRFRVSVSEDESMIPARFRGWYVNGPYVAEDPQVAFDTVYEAEQGVALEATYEDGRQKWVEVLPGYADGKKHALDGDIAATFLYRTLRSPTERAVTFAIGSNDAVKVWLNGALVHENYVGRTLTPGEDRVQVTLAEGENTLLLKVVNFGNEYGFSFAVDDEEVGGLSMELASIFGIIAFERTDEQISKLQRIYRRVNSPEWKALDDELSGVRAEKKKLDDAIPTTMVMAEMDDPRETFVLMRGQYDQPTTKVEAAIPAAFPPLPEGAAMNRLGFAQWLVDPSHPFTARVTVNRYWQQYFGTGIVKTSEDFGIQGDWPSHPDLLDWLAVEFVESGWDVKALHRLIVTSATYRQSSKATADLFERDPENRLLARGPRLRLDAEMVRDNALALSGLLVQKLGGPSVRPYQPMGLWKDVAYGATFTAQTFEQDKGDDLYRRSMYTFWKRQSPPPGMMLFDAPDRETCSSRRSRTNTPLQALALLNDPQYVEAARFFAQRLMTEAGPEIDDRIDFAYQLATARLPSTRENEILQRIFSEQLRDFNRDLEGAKAFLSVGDEPYDAKLDVSELAAWTTIASIILNLDETITKI